MHEICQCFKTNKMADARSIITVGQLRMLANQKRTDKNLFFFEHYCLHSQWCPKQKSYDEFKLFSFQVAS